MSGQTILLVSIAASGAVTAGSAVLAGLTFSAAVGGPVLGALLDRARRPGTLLSGALFFYAVGLCATAATLGRLPEWTSVGAALVIGLCMPAISGGWSSRLKSFVAAEHITRASAIDAATFNIAGLAGPAFAGLLAAAHAYWAVMAMSLLLFAALPMAWQLPEQLRASAALRPLRHDISAGLRAIWLIRALRRITLMSAISYMGIGILWVTYPLAGKALLGNAGYGGMLASVLAAAAVIATAGYAKWPTKYGPDVIAVATTLVLAAAMLMLAFATNITTALFSMVLAGCADGPQLAAIFAIRHREAPEYIRSQVFTTGASLKITAAAMGTALAGRLAERSWRTTLFAAVAVQLLAGTVFLACGDRQNA